MKRVNNEPTNGRKGVQSITYDFESFYSNVRYEPSRGCLLWCGTRAAGYGKFGPRLAHRVAWELHHGPIPPGVNALHKCDVRHCVSIAHLFLGTQADNVADMLAKGRGYKGLKTAWGIGYKNVLRKNKSG